ncbi:MAG: ABC transporter permease [Verrucomicrobia bacterium]|nr:ABC transporter permease [Verrucomicrobiota bacterium]MBI3871136.1 ABC transporter permease [Verrucomicrobiota bacterium]
MSNAASQSASSRPGAARGLASAWWLRHETILAVLVVGEWLFFNSVGRRFGTWDNTFDILRHSAEIGLLSLALTPVILTGGIDLSVGSLLGLCAVVFGKLWRDAGLPVAAAASITLVVGGLAGGVNAALISGLRLPPLIVTLGSFSLFRGLAEALTRGVDTFTNFPSGFLFIGQERWLGVPAQTPVFLAAASFFWIWVHRTAQGRSFRAIGFSPEGSQYAGIPVRRRVASVYVAAGVVAAVAAILYTARLGQAKADAGTGYELYAITAVVLGGTSIFGGVGSVHGALLGVIAIAILNNGLVHARQPREVAGMLTGVLLIVALSVKPAIQRVALSWSRRKPGAKV